MADSQNQVMLVGTEQEYASAIRPGMSIREVAAKLGLPLNQEGEPEDVTLRENVKLSWSYDPRSGSVLYAATVPSTLSDVREVLDKAQDYERIQPSQELSLVRELFEREGVATRTIEALIENARMNGGYVMKVKNETARQLCQAWLQWVNAFDRLSKKNRREKASHIAPIGGIEGVFYQALLAFFRDGDWVATEYWDEVYVPQIGKAAKLPVRITTHDKASLEFDETAAKLGLDVIYLKLDRSITSLVRGRGRQASKADLLQEIGEWVKKAVRNGESKVMLPPALTTHLKRWGEDYSPTGRSYLKPFLGPMADKIRLRALDRATISGLVQRLTIIMLGHDNPDSPFHAPTKERFQLLQRVLKNIRTMHFGVWMGRDLDVLDIGPDGKVLEIDQKYKEVNADLRKASGITQLLIDGTAGTTTQRDWASFVGAVNRLNVIRDWLERWTSQKLRQILEENGFEDEFPRFSFRPLGMRDERDMWNVVLSAFARGVQGRRATLRDLGKDPDAIIEEQLAEADEGLNQILLPPPTSFTVAPGRPGGVPDGFGRKPTKGEGGEKDRARTIGASRHAHEDELEAAIEELTIRVGDREVDLSPYARDLRMQWEIMAKRAARLADDDDEGALYRALAAGFGAMAAILDSMVAEIFAAAGLGEIEPSATRSGMIVHAWNGRYIWRFMHQMIRKVQALRSRARGKEDIAEMVSALFDSESKRLPLYISEGSRKAAIGAELEAKKPEFVIVATAGDDKVCEECAADEGRRMKAEEFLLEYPKHPRCRCTALDVSG